MATQITITITSDGEAVDQLKEEIMAKIEDVNAALDQEMQARQAAVARINEDVAELRRLLSERAAPEELDAVAARIAESTAALAGIDPDPAFPPAPEA